MGAGGQKTTTNSSPGFTAKDTRSIVLRKFLGGLLEVFASVTDVAILIDGLPFQTSRVTSALVK